MVVFEIVLVAALGLLLSGTDDYPDGRRCDGRARRRGSLAAMSELVGVDFGGAALPAMHESEKS